MKGRKPKPLTNSVELTDEELKILLKVLTLGLSFQPFRSCFGSSMSVLKDKIESIEIRRLERTNLL